MINERARNLKAIIWWWENESWSSMWHRLEGEERLELKKKKIPIPIYISTHVHKLARQTFKRDIADIIASQRESSTHIFESWKTANRQQHGSWRYKHCLTCSRAAESELFTRLDQVSQKVFFSVHWGKTFLRYTLSLLFYALSGKLIPPLIL